MFSMFFSVCTFCIVLWSLTTLCNACCSLTSLCNACYSLTTLCTACYSLSSLCNGCCSLTILCDALCPLTTTLNFFHLLLLPFIFSVLLRSAPSVFFRTSSTCPELVFTPHSLYTVARFKVSGSPQVLNMWLV